MEAGGRFPGGARPRGALAADRRRFEELSPAAAEVIRTATVLGDEFDQRELAALSGRPEPEVELALAEATAARLLAGDATRARYRFRHRELCRSLYADLSSLRRRELHQRAAARLERLAAAGVAVPAERIAAHYVATGDRGRGREWSVAAAEERAAAHEPHQAIAWYRHAIALGGPGAEGAPAEDLWRLKSRLAELSALVGDAARAAELYAQAREAAACLPAERVRLGRRLAEMRHRVGEGDAAIDLLMSCLEESRRHRLGREEIECHLAIGQALYYAADYKRGLEHAVAGSLLARASGDRRQAAELGRLTGALETSLGDTESAFLHLEGALADARTLDDEVLLARIDSEVGRTAVHAGDYQRATLALERAIAVFQRVRWLEREAGAVNNLGGASYHRGDWERARSSWERFRRLCERLEWHAELITALNNLGLLYRDLGQLQQAMDVLDRAADLARRVSHQRMAAIVCGNRGEVLFRRGQLAEADDCYRRALAEFERIGAREEVVESKRRLCELAIATGNCQEALDRAVDVLRDAKDSGARLEEGILHRVAATAARLCGDLESAAWFSGRARELLGEIGARYELARLDIEQGQLAAATGRTEEAVRFLENAVEVLSTLGARWELTRARAQLRAVRPRFSDSELPAQSGQLRLLVELASITGNLETDKVLEQTLDGALALTGFDRGFILLLDEDGRPRERTRRVRPGAPAFARDEAQLSGSIVRRVAGTRQALAITDAAGEEELLEHRSAISLGLRQVLCAPMMVRGQIIGIVYMDSRRLSAKDHRVDLPVLEAFASLAAQAVENSRLAEEVRRKTELMAILAHEIRNPLSGILGYSDIGEQEERERGGESAALFARIRRDGERLRRLVDNVLELARHEAGHVDWSFFTFEVSDMVNDAVAAFRPACVEANIRLEVDTTGADVPVFGNPDRLTQVLVNLIGNAVKFTPERGMIRVTARRETIPATDPHVPPSFASGVQAWAPLDPSASEMLNFLRIDVSDTGPGMTEEIRSRLFEKYAQGKSSRSKGVGLGLYISREIVRRHGGVIWVESQLGAGATFSVRIPLP